MEPTQKPQFRINVSQDHKPIFTNSVRVNVSNDEVTLQFLYLRPGTQDGALVSEVVMTPGHAIRFQQALNDTLKKHYDKSIGAVSEGGSVKDGS